MAVAPGIVSNDSSVYMALESAKGSAGSVFKGGFGFTKFSVKPVLEVTKGVPMLGGGYYMQQSVGRGVLVNITAEGWVTLDVNPAMLLATIATKGTTSVASSVSTTPYTLITKNINKKYATIALIDGETSVGAGIMIRLFRDAIMTNLKYTFAGNDAIKWNASWIALNYGPGSGSETFSFNSNYNIPNPGNSGNVYSYPGFFPADVCVHNIGVEWTGQSNVGDICLGSGEHSDIYIIEAGWKVTAELQADSNSKQVYDTINSKTTTPATGTSAFLPGLQAGAVSLTVKSDNVIPSTSTKYSMALSLPSLQWTNAEWTNDNPERVLVESDSFGSDATLTFVNGLSSAAMTL